MISATARPYIEASVPVLREHGLAITSQFYASMFEAHPELSNLFNMGNQASGVQQQSLASAVFAYAAHIDQPAALAPVVERIVHKHVAVGIKPSHYPIVGRHLLGAIRQVLGDAATPELLGAWDEAYWLLAGELIAAEARLYERLGTDPGVLRDLRVARVEHESEDIVSIYLQTPEGGTPGPFRPGQYVSVAMQWTEPGDPLPHQQLRQYSLSDAPSQPWWRVTVKRERGQETPAGRVSNWLHDHVREGDTLAVGPACGDFTPLLEGQGPLVLISAGVGVTPMMSVLKALADANPQRPVVFAHAARSPAHHALRQDLEQTARRLAGLRTVLFYEQLDGVPVGQADSRPSVHQGFMQLDTVLDGIELDRASVYLCGPLNFMRAQWTDLLARGLKPGQLDREVFGPELLDHLL